MLTALTQTLECAPCAQEVVAAPGGPSAAARLAAAHVAALQRQLAMPPASLQLSGAGDSIASQPVPAPLAGRGTPAGSVRALAAMLRVASVEAPATHFSMVEVSAAAAASDAGVAAASPAASRLAADAHGLSLSAGAWLAPRLTARQPEAAGGSAAGFRSAASFTAPTGRIIVTGQCVVCVWILYDPLAPRPGLEVARREFQQRGRSACTACASLTVSIANHRMSNFCISALQVARAP